MKFKNLIIVLFLTFIFFPSCNKEKIYACDVTNPLKNLSWLKEKVIDLKRLNRFDSDQTANIFFIELEDQDIFGINHCIDCSHVSVQYYDCVGNYLCGGQSFSSYDRCEFSEEDFIVKTLIWTND